MVDSTDPADAPAADEPAADAPAADEPDVTRELPPVHPAPPVAVSQPQTLGILALILGIVGLLASAAAAGLVFGIAAAILGHLSLRREPAARGMALGGLITGYVSIGISVVWGIIMLAALLIPLFAVGLFAGLGSFGG